MSPKTQKKKKEKPGISSGHKNLHFYLAASAPTTPKFQHQND
jgi:hypothetical protein